MKKNRNIDIENNSSKQDIQELIQTVAQLKDPSVVYDFFKDLCTPQELKSMADRWKVCKLLDSGELSYREIQEQTGVSLATIVRVARFLNTEPHRGYEFALKNLNRS